MRFSFRVKLRNLTFFAMIAKTQTLEGVTSLQTDGTHFVMFDVENCSLQQAEEALIKVQRKYCLSDIFVVSDVEKSYRAWCFSKVDFKTFQHILLETEYLDPNFLDYTFRRKKATLRTGSKKGRPTQKVVSILKSYSVPIPIADSRVEKVIYDTGFEKRGFSLLLGGD